MRGSKTSINAKVRPVANPSLEKASLLGAARIYVSKDALIALTGGLEFGQICVIERLAAAGENGDENSEVIKREASLWSLQDKNVSPNVVLMTRAFQEAAGFKLGDQVRITVGDATKTAEEVVVFETTEKKDGDEKDREVDKKALAVYPQQWPNLIAHALKRAEQVFPNMILEGVACGKIRKSFKVISVDSRKDALANFEFPTKIRISQSEEDDSAPTPREFEEGELELTGIAGLAPEVESINIFLSSFTRPFLIPDEAESCALVIHGGRGSGKTFILQKLSETKWGAVHWIRPADKLTSIKEIFKQSREQKQPSMIFFDEIESILSKDRSNRELVIDAIGEELDALSALAKAQGGLPSVIVVATCSDYLVDIPIKLKRPSRFNVNIILPIPRAPERLEILTYLDPPLDPKDKQSILEHLASKSYAFNSADLVTLISNAKRAFITRIYKTRTIDRKRQPSSLSSAVPAETTDKHTDGSTQQTDEGIITQNYLSKEDFDIALSQTRPSAMYDVNLKPPTIHWNDVGGQESLKEILTEMIDSVKSNENLRRNFVAVSPKGLLMYGPPGCSKTLLAQAMATESSFNFFAIKASELLNMYVGESERALRTLFARARAATPAIIFFDEIDSIGGGRGDGGSSGKSSGAVNMLTTLLTEMDGFEVLKGVLILAATNRPEVVDPALMRPGRFDQIVYVGPPDLAAREAVFKVHLLNKGLKLAEDVDVKELARISEGYSGAEIAAMCFDAGTAVWQKFKREEGWKTDPKVETTKIQMADLVDAVTNRPKGITWAMVSGYETWSKQFSRK